MEGVSWGHRSTRAQRSSWTEGTTASLLLSFCPSTRLLKASNSCRAFVCVSGFAGCPRAPRRTGTTGNTGETITPHVIPYDGFSEAPRESLFQYHYVQCILHWVKSCFIIGCLYPLEGEQFTHTEWYSNWPIVAQLRRQWRTSSHANGMVTLLCVHFFVCVLVCQLYLLVCWILPCICEHALVCVYVCKYLCMMNCTMFLQGDEGPLGPPGSVGPTVRTFRFTYLENHELIHKEKHAQKMTFMGAVLMKQFA